MLRTLSPFRGNDALLQQVPHGRVFEEVPQVPHQELPKLHANPALLFHDDETMQRHIALHLRDDDSSGYEHEEEQGGEPRWFLRVKHMEDAEGKRQ